MPDQLYRITPHTYLEDEPDHKGRQRIDGFVTAVEPDYEAAGNAIMHEIDRDTFWITRREVIGKLAVDAALKVRPKMMTGVWPKEVGNDTIALKGDDDDR